MFPKEKNSKTGLVCLNIVKEGNDYEARETYASKVQAKML